MRDNRQDAKDARTRVSCLVATLAPWRLIFALSLILPTSACKRSDSSDPNATTQTIKVAAAADLAFAFRDLGIAFEKKTGTKVVFTFGSTGNLAKQIAEGATYDLFAAANVSFVDDVTKAGACDAATKTPYARGRIVVWTSDDAKIDPPKSLADLADKRFVKIAIANPEHAPYGAAAQQALTSAGVWETVKPKLVYGENVQQTLQFGQTGNAEAAIVALSLATVTEGGKWVMIDDAQHKPIDQALVVCNRGGNVQGAKDFSAFLGSADGRTVMRKYGFVLPGESVVKAP
jgi:molybdate transport system substrate-binding protein